MNIASFVSLVKNPTSGGGGGREILKKAADLSNGRWPGGIQNMHKPWPQKRDYSDIAIQVMTVLWDITNRCLERLESPKRSWVHSCDQNSKFKLQVTSDTATHSMVFQQEGKHWWRPGMSDEALVVGLTAISDGCVSRNKVIISADQHHGRHFGYLG